MYRIIRQILFLFPPEWVHYFSMNMLRLLCGIPIFKKVISNYFSADRDNSPQKISCCGLNFKNPVGLGAGFDKNAKYLNEMQALGFGFAEIGTVTPRPQAGNDKPRLFRLPKDKALINRMGFNNDGAEVIAERLRRWAMGKEQLSMEETAVADSRSSFALHHSQMLIGGNIGKNKATPNEDAWMDYEACFKRLYPYVDYFVVNVSSPNTPGLRELQEKESLRKILTNLSVANRQLSIQQPGGSASQSASPIQHSAPKPILLKIAPDLSQQQIDDVIDLALEIKLDGIVATNTTTDRSRLKTSDIQLKKMGAGGLSGLPVKKRSTEIVSYIHQKTNGRIPIIASGGIFNVSDAREKIAAGASLLQVWTGFVYEGPDIVKKICRNL